MTNDALLPFTRNRYFFGKLLTQRDMEAEQDYFNNKRRLLNVLQNGSGVICGLNVVKVDGATVAVKSGLALDGLGRELVVPEPVVARLSDLEGFDGDYGISPYVYLCIEYAETPCEPMHAMTDEATAEPRYGRVEESVRIYLRYGEPDSAVIARPDNSSKGEWRGESLETKLERGAREKIYLARINLVRWEEAYEVGEIEHVPFGQFATANCASERYSFAGSEEAQQENTQNPRLINSFSSQEKELSPDIAFGTAKINIPPEARQGSLHYSDDIPHGLGFASVFIMLGYAYENGAIFGDTTIFRHETGFEWAVKTNDLAGTFRVGIRINASIANTELRFNWIARAGFEEAAVTSSAPQIVVEPGIKRIAPLESVQFVAAIHELPDKDVIWSVFEQDGGGITEDGHYIAPNANGVFTVCASSPSNPEITGTAFVVVSDT